jgi:hypothetical protein
MATELTPLVRVISGKGTITIPEEFANASLIVLYVDVVRESRSVYRNYNSSPSESYFGRICACYDDYVLDKRQIEFDRQMFQVFPGDVSDVMQAVKCLERSIYLGLQAVAVIAGGAILTPDPFPLDVYEPQGYVPNNFKFWCYGGTALRLTLKGYENETCGDNEFPRKKPPIPPEPPEPVEPGTPVEVSPPEPDYPEATDPFEGDTEDDGFPIGERCSKYECTATMFFSDRPEVTRTSVFFGEIEAFFVNEDESGGQRAAIIIRAYGIPLPEGDDVCNAFATDYIFIQADELGIYDSVSIETPVLVP